MESKRFYDLGDGRYQHVEEKLSDSQLNDWDGISMQVRQMKGAGRVCELVNEEVSR